MNRSRRGRTADSRPAALLALLAFVAQPILPDLHAGHGLAEPDATPAHITLPATDGVRGYTPLCVPEESATPHRGDCPVCRVLSHAPMMGAARDHDGTRLAALSEHLPVGTPTAPIERSPAEIAPRPPPLLA